MFFYYNITEIYNILFVNVELFIVFAFHYVYHIAYFFKKSIFDLVFFRHTTTQYLHNIRIFMENLFIYGEVA